MNPVESQKNRAADDSRQAKGAPGHPQRASLTARPPNDRPQHQNGQRRIHEDRIGSHKGRVTGGKTGKNIAIVIDGKSHNSGQSGTVPGITIVGGTIYTLAAAAVESRTRDHGLPADP